MSLSESVDAALAAEEHEGRDGGTVALARFYAATIDEASDAEMPERLAQLGPKLLAALEALNMSPRARGAAMKGATGGARNPLDELRQRRAERTAG